MTGSAKQSRSGKFGLDCFVTEFIIGPAKGRIRWLLAMTATCAALPLVVALSQSAAIRIRMINANRNQG
jgi:hypothetical protein